VIGTNSGQLYRALEERTHATPEIRIPFRHE
jgi:hypothetical protein